MSGFFVSLVKRLIPTQKKTYLPEVLQAATLDECDPSEIFWCDDCREFHKDYK